MRELTQKEWLKVDELVEKSGCSIAEAKEMVLVDAEVEANPTAFDLPKELEAGAKKARQADRKKTGSTRKPDPLKQKIIGVIFCALSRWFTSNEKGTFNVCQNITKTNIERQIDFEIDGRKFRLVLSAPRS